ncbi:MAG: HugZ family protein [Myxococcota bacterium]
MGRGHHAPPSGSRRRRQELLYDPEVATPSHAERARTLVAAQGTGTLCTLTVEPEGFPYGSFVTFALDEGSPVFLVSRLAEHTKNLLREPRCSLMVSEPGEGDPLARGRVTMVGRCEELAEGEASASARESYLARHPNASYYVDFKDFSFWRLTVTSLRYIGGYGRMSWVEQEDWSGATPDPIANAAAPIIAHMNDDHADTMVLYCKAFSKASDTSAAQMTGVDRYGFEMSATTAEGPRPIRLAFPAPITRPDEVRSALVQLAKAARTTLGMPAKGGQH